MCILNYYIHPLLGVNRSLCGYAVIIITFLTMSVGEELGSKISLLTTLVECYIESNVS